MHRIAFFACFLALGTACGAVDGVEVDPASSTTDARLVVDYDYGDQLTHSAVRIFDNGVVVRTEETCCTARTEPLLTTPLPHTVIAALLEDIEETSRTATESDIDEGSLVGAGGARANAKSKAKSKVRSGSLVVVDARGRRITIRAVGDTEAPALPSPRARSILTLVNGMAFQKIPVDS